jgi:hypothetical protein
VRPEQPELESRIDRIESTDAIRQLVSRYGVCLDGRDIDGLVDLFVEDVRVGRERRGRAALRESFFDLTGVRGVFRITVHLVGNHVIDFDDKDPDRATGVVYCRAEHEVGDRWIVEMLQYWDTYERRGRTWFFARRQMKAWYVADVLERPNGADRLKWELDPVGLVTRAEIPEALPSWARFWAEVDEQRRTAAGDAPPG